jgi:hypothetical protein
LFGSGPRRRGNFIGEAVDRLLADKRIDPGIEVEGDKLAGVFVCVVHRQDSRARPV